MYSLVYTNSEITSEEISGQTKEINEQLSFTLPNKKTLVFVSVRLDCDNFSAEFNKCIKNIQNKLILLSKINKWKKYYKIETLSSLKKLNKT